MIKRLLLLTVMALFLVGCGGSKRATKKRTSIEGSTPTVTVNEGKNAPADTDPKTDKIAESRPYDNVEGYINAFATIAMDEMRQYGIPASITLAQAVLESGAGRGELTLKANNHFGIKCHDWKGARVYHDDDEKGECFRKYRDPKFSFRDHSLFLTGRGRYAFLFQLDKEDYEGWAKGLKKAGYATDRKYPDKLISIIERYGLDQFDREVLGDGYGSKLTAEETVERYTVKAGDTLYAIARKFNLTVDTLKKYNGLQGNIINVGQVLYVQPIN